MFASAGMLHPENTICPLLVYIYHFKIQIHFYIIYTHICVYLGCPISPMKMFIFPMYGDLWDTVCMYYMEVYLCFEMIKNFVLIQCD